MYYINIALRHDTCIIDKSYNFNMSKFNVLDNVLLSGTLYDKCIDSVSDVLYMMMVINYLIMSQLY